MQPSNDHVHWLLRLLGVCMIVAGTSWLIFLATGIIFQEDVLSPPDIALPFFLAFATVTAPVAILLIVLGFSLRKWGL